MTTAETVGQGGRGFALRVASFFAAIFFVTGIKTTYFPVWLNWLGLTPAEISIIAASPLFLRIVGTPAMAFIADRYGDRRQALLFLAWFGVGVLIAMTGVSGFWPIFLLTLALSLSSTTIMPLTETIAMEGVRRSGQDYGRMRLWGSLSFIAATFIAGVVVARLGAQSIIGLMLIGGILTAIAAHALPRSGGGDAQSAGRKPVPGDVLRLVASPPFAMFLLATGAVQGAHAMFYTFGVLHWQEQGISAVAASTLWSIGVVVEIGLFAFSGAAVRRFGAAGLIVAGAFASVLRWWLMMFDPPLAGLVLLQVLHGLTFGATHLGAVHVMASLAPPQQAGSAQALYASVTSGIALGGATLVVGWMFPLLGSRAYGAMAALAAVGLVVSLWLWRRMEKA